MGNRLQFYQNLVVLLMTISVAETSVVQRIYNKLEPGQIITGEIVPVRSQPECALR